MRHIVHRLLLVLAALLVGLLLVEVGIRLTRVDGHQMVKQLYYQGGRPDLHEAVDDPDLMFRLIPGAEGMMMTMLEEECPISVNSQGARSQEWGLQKTETTTRILFLGASTVYGTGVCDDEALPATLALALDERRPGWTHQVWNFGTSAYNRSQVAHRGRLELANIPDVDLLVMLPTNTGRRPFMDGTLHQKLAYYAYFRRDPSLWMENFYPEGPWPHLSHERTDQLHWVGLRLSALYRYVTFAHVRRARREASLLEQEAASTGVPVVWVLWPQNIDVTDGWREQIYPFGEHWISLHRPGLSEEETDLHPPREVLAVRGAELADALLEGGWLD